MRVSQKFPTPAGDPSNVPQRQVITIEVERGDDDLGILNGLVAQGRLRDFLTVLGRPDLGAPRSKEDVAGALEAVGAMVNLAQARMGELMHLARHGFGLPWRTIAARAELPAASVQRRVEAVQRDYDAAGAVRSREGFHTQQDELGSWLHQQRKRHNSARAHAAGLLRRDTSLSEGLGGTVGELMTEAGILLGIADRSPVSLDPADLGHIYIGSGTGAGSTSLARAILAQALHNGDIAMILDPKGIDHSWARGIPNVVHCAELEDVRRALAQLAGELDRRAAITESQAATSDGGLGPRLWLLLEQLPTLRQSLKRSNDKASLDILARAITDGGPLGVAVLAVSPSHVSATKVPELFETRILARVSYKAWRLLAPEILPVPGPPASPGGWHVVHGGQASEMQAVYFEPDEARQYAINGAVTHIAQP